MQDPLFAPLAALGRLRGYRARYPKYELPQAEPAGKVERSTG
jgi:hypothetical protein